jgi:DNA-binding SARP family transcriptional activator
MTHFIIRHFGGTRITIGGKSTFLPNDFPTGMFAYLSHHVNQTIGHGQLAGLFWPELSERRARRALSTALWRMHTVTEIAPFIKRTATSIGLTRSRIWVDTVAFEKHLLHAQRLSKSMPSQALSRIKQLIRDSDTGVFTAMRDDWGLQKRFLLENLHCDALYLGAQIAGQLNNAMTLTHCARQLIAREPYREDIRTLQISHAAKCGHHATARKHYDTYRTMMAAEYQAAPKHSLDDLTAPAPRRVMPAID